jgi:arginine repressor
MFEDIIGRIGSNLGLNKDEIKSDEFINSQLVKSICTQLINGNIVVLDSNRGFAALTKKSIDSLHKNKLIARSRTPI